MAIHGGFINSTIICSEKKEVNIDALNFLASGGVAQLCSCSYKNEKGHHHFVYDTENSFPLTSLQAGLTFENTVDILSSALAVVEAVLQNNLVLDNVKNAKEYIFKSESGFKFIYMPIVHKPHVKVRDYLLKLISVIHHKDSRITNMVKGLRKLKDDAHVIAYIKDFIKSNEAYSFPPMDMASEGETTVLSQQPFTPQPIEYAGPVASEGETTVLSGQPFTPQPIEYAQPVASEGETTVLSQQPFTPQPIEYAQPVASEGETTVLSQQPFTPQPIEYAQPVASEGETTVLSGQPFTPQPIEYAGPVASEGETTVLSGQPFTPQPIEYAQPAESEGETTVLSQSGYDRMQEDANRVTEYYHDASAEYETTVLTSAPPMPPQMKQSAVNQNQFLYLVRNINGEKISVDVTPFTIGKDSANMDYVLNNDSVSRHHATVVYEDGAYFIMDNNSTNGTVIEGIRLQPGEKAELGDSYIITLGNESFQAFIERR